MMCFDPISYDKAEKARKHSENVQEQLNQHKLDYIEENLLKQQVVLEFSDGTKNEFTINEQGNYEMTVNLGWCRLKDLEYHGIWTGTRVDTIKYRRPVDMIKGCLTSIIDIINMEEVKGTIDLTVNVGKYTTVGTTGYIEFVVSKGTTREDFESSINMDSLVIYKLADPYTVVMPDNISANTKELIRLSIKSKEIASDLSAHKEDYENQFPITNLVRMELEDWIPGDSTNTITGNTIINKSNPTVTYYPRAISNNKSITGNVYYGRATLKVNTEDCTRIVLTLNNSSTGVNRVDDPEMGVLYTLSVVHKATSVQPLITVGHVYDTQSSEHTMEIKDVISINLTEVFGAGNEPTKQEADEMFSSLNWFEGKLNWKETFKVLSKKSTLITPDSIRNKDGLGQSPYLRNYKIIEFDHSKWVATSDTPSLSVETDREFVKFGYDSLKVVAHPTEATVIEYTFDKPIDLSNKYMNLWVYIPNNMMKSSQEIKFSTIAIYFMTPQGWVTQWQDRGYHRYEGMQPIVASPHTLNHVYAGGNGDMTQVSKIRIRIEKDPTNTEPVELYINAMSTYDFVNEHYMSIEFDDALLSVFNVAFPEMNRRGIRGGVWVITSYMKAGINGYCESWQLLKMQDAGWDVGSHSVTHPHLSELTEEEQLYELKQSQQDLIDIGIYRGPQFFVAPYGDSTLYSRKMAKTIYVNWRMTGWRKGNGVILEDPYLREGITIASGGVEGTKALIDHLVSKPGGYLPIVLHGEVGGTFEGYSFTAEEFGEILDYALSKGVKFITNSDMFPNTEIRR